MVALARYLERKMRGRFFGQVVVSFENGKVTSIKENRTLKLDDLEKDCQG